MHRVDRGHVLFGGNACLANDDMKIISSRSSEGPFIVDSSRYAYKSQVLIRKKNAYLFCEGTLVGRNGLPGDSGVVGQPYEVRMSYDSAFIQAICRREPEDPNFSAQVVGLDHPNNSLTPKDATFAEVPVAGDDSTWKSTGPFGFWRSSEFGDISFCALLNVANEPRVICASN